VGVSSNLIMSRVFYDRLVAFDHIDRELNKIVETKEEREELWKIIDEYIHHRVVGCILAKLPKEHHEEFLTRFTDAPHHESHFKYLTEKIPTDVERFLRDEIVIIGNELLEVIKGKPTKKKK
jgi:hypothetical protein